MYQNAELQEVDFSKGIDAWNREALLGVLDAANAAYTKSHPMQNREHKPGFVDDICNFDFTDDGKLLQRGNLIPNAFANLYFPNSTKNRRVTLITHEAYMDTISNVHTWMLMISDLTTGASEFYRRNDFTPWFTKTIGVGARTSGLFYNTKWYVYRSDGTSAFHINSTPTVTDFTASYTNSQTSGLREVLLWKDRAWARFYDTICFSKATDPTVWTTPDGGFFQLSSKGPIKAMRIWNDALYIMDGVHNIWVYTFTTDPNADGVLTQLIPAADIPSASTVSSPTGPSAYMCVSKGDLYVAGGSNIYQVVNNRVYPIADQLHLSLSGRDELFIFNLGDKLMAVSYYWGATSKNMRCYIYHHNVRAWTRYHFDFGATEVETDKVYINQVQVFQHGYYTSAVITLEGSSFTVPDLFAEYKPVYLLRINEPFFAGSMHDQIINVYDGYGGRIYKSPRLILDSGPIYISEKDTYKKFLEARLDAHLGYRQAGSTHDDTPYKASAIPVPTSAGTPILTDWSRLMETETSEFPYRLPINQRSRGIRFIFQTDPASIESWNDYQDTFISTETVVSRAYISKIAIRYRATTRLRPVKSSTAYADANDL